MVRAKGRYAICSSSLPMANFARLSFLLLFIFSSRSFAASTCDNIYSLSKLSTQRQFFKNATTTTVRDILKKTMIDETPQWVRDVSGASVPENTNSVARLKKELATLAGMYSQDRLEQLRPLFQRALKLANFVQKNNYPQRQVTELFLTYTHLVDARRRNSKNLPQIETSISEFVSAFMYESHGYQDFHFRYYGKYIFTFENPSRLDFVRARAAGYSLVGISNSDLNAFDTIENQTASFFARHDLIHASRELASDYRNWQNQKLDAITIEKIQKEDLLFIKNILIQIENISDLQLRKDLEVLLFYLTHEAYLNLRIELKPLFYDTNKMQMIKHNLANDIYFGTLGPQLKSEIPHGENQRVEKAFQVLQKMQN